LSIADIHVFYNALKNSYGIGTQHRIQVIAFKISGFLIENYIYSKIRTIIWYISYAYKSTNLPFALEYFDFWSDLTVAHSQKKINIAAVNRIIEIYQLTR